MKSLPALKLLLMLVVAAWMHVLAVPTQADAVLLADTVAATAPTTKVMGAPETSSVVLIGALGLMLMLRRRRLHA